MARKASVKLVGLERVERNLEKLADRGKDNLEGLVRMATNEIAAEAKRLAPVDSGDYRDTIKGKSDGITGIIAAWRGSRVHPISHLIEFGTQPHEKHPGTTAKPHLFPAFEMVTSRLGGRIAEALRKAGGGLR